MFEVDGDAGLGELLLQQDGDLLVDFVAGVDDILQLEIGGTGFGQHRLGLLRIIGALQVSA